MRLDPGTLPLGHTICTDFGLLDRQQNGIRPWQIRFPDLKKSHFCWRERERIGKSQSPFPAKVRLLNPTETSLQFGTKFAALISCAFMPTI
jgi:hypothetical protein